MHTQTHTCLTALCPELPRWAGTKPIWILLKQETVNGSGISWAICKSAPRSRQITTPAPHHSSFLQAGCPSCHPTNSVKALKATRTTKQGYGKSHQILANLSKKLERSVLKKSAILVHIKTKVTRRSVYKLDTMPPWYTWNLSLQQASCGILLPSAGRQSTTHGHWTDTHSLLCSYTCSCLGQTWAQPGAHTVNNTPSIYV